MKPIPTIAIAALALCGQAAVGQQASTGAVAGQRWSYELKIYGWGTAVGGEALGEEFELGFDELLEKLNFALMGGLVATRGDWGYYVEGSYAHLGGDDSINISVLPGAPAGGADVDLDVSVEQTVLNFGASYKLAQTEDFRLDATFGGRYLGIDTEFEAEGPLQTHRVSEYQDFWDAVVGLSGRASLNETWFVPFNVDIGAGESDLTWQAWAGVGYEFGRSDLVFGYRHMEWDLGDGGLVTEYCLSGPALLWNYRF